MAKGRVDPQEKEKQGRAYYVDGDVDRRNEATVLKYLQMKYAKPRLMNIQMNFYSAATSLRTE
jgi:hypothetical protein